MSSTDSDSAEDSCNSPEDQSFQWRAAPILTRKMASIGKIDVFDETQESWASYTEHLEQYFIVNEIGDDRKVPALLSLIGPKTYGLVRVLTAPTKPSRKTFAELVTTLQAHLAPKPLTIAERFRFHKRDQKEEESVNAYAAELRRLSEHCEFGTNLNESLRDRFVCGLGCEGYPNPNPIDRV